MSKKETRKFKAVSYDLNSHPVVMEDLTRDITCDLYAFPGFEKMKERMVNIPDDDDDTITDSSMANKMAGVRNENAIQNILVAWLKGDS